VAGMCEELSISSFFFRWGLGGLKFGFRALFMGEVFSDPFLGDFEKDVIRRSTLWGAWFWV